MEIMLNGQLVSCTPKEYKELMDMGLVPGPDSVATRTDRVCPGNIPVLPDDINQLQETNPIASHSHESSECGNTSIEQGYADFIESCKKNRKL